MAHWLGIEGSVCIVTGAGRGIGASIALSFAEAGAVVGLIDRDAETVNDTFEKVRQIGAKSFAIVADISNSLSIKDAAAQTLEKLGPAAVLVNNAATILPGAILDIDIPAFEHLMNVNLNGALICSQVYAKQMIARGRGSIVHIGSLSGAFPQPNSGSYSVSKASVSMLAKLLAVELGEKGIRSNVVSPGSVRTPLSAGLFANPEIVAQRQKMIPIRRFGDPQDIADSVMFLASERSSYITGQILTVDGGLNCALMGLMPRPGFEASSAGAESASD